MNHLTGIRFILIIVFCGLLVPVTALGQSELPKNKQTEPGLYVTAQEAYNKWRSNPSGVKIVDVRTPEEYVFIGHPPMAHNIPSMLLKEAWYAGSKGAMKPNPGFVSQVKKKFKPSDTLFLICRSGGRSARAVNLLAKEGFKNVYTVTDGFEGSKVKDKSSYFKGKRLLNGWKNSNSPWTYNVKPELAYISVLKEEPDKRK